MPTSSKPNIVSKSENERVKPQPDISLESNFLITRQKQSDFQQPKRLPSADVIEPPLRQEIPSIQVLASSPGLSEAAEAEAKLDADDKSKGGAETEPKLGVVRSIFRSSTDVRQFPSALLPAKHVASERRSSLFREKELRNWDGPEEDAPSDSRSVRFSLRESQVLVFQIESSAGAVTGQSDTQVKYDQSTTPTDEETKSTTTLNNTSQERSSQSGNNNSKNSTSKVVVTVKSAPTASKTSTTTTPQVDPPKSPSNRLSQIDASTSYINNPNEFTNISTKTSETSTSRSISPVSSRIKSTPTSKTSVTTSPQVNPPQSPSNRLSQIDASATSINDPKTTRSSKNISTKTTETVTPRSISPVPSRIKSIPAKPKKENNVPSIKKPLRANLEDIENNLLRLLTKECEICHKGEIYNTKKPNITPSKPIKPSNSTVPKKGSSPDSVVIQREGTSPVATSKVSLATVNVPKKISPITRKSIQREGKSSVATSKVSLATLKDLGNVSTPGRGNVQRKSTTPTNTVKLSLLAIPEDYSTSIVPEKVDAIDGSEASNNLHKDIPASSILVLTPPSGSYTGMKASVSTVLNKSKVVSKSDLAVFKEPNWDDVVDSREENEMSVPAVAKRAEVSSPTRRGKDKVPMSSVSPKSSRNKTPADSEDFFGDWLSGLRRGECSAKELLQACRQTPDLVLDNIRRRRGERHFEDRPCDNFVSDFSRTHGERFGDPKYHYLMVDAWTTLSPVHSGAMVISATKEVKEKVSSVTIVPETKLSSATIEPNTRVSSASTETKTSIPKITTPEITPATPSPVVKSEPTPESPLPEAPLTEVPFNEAYEPESYEDYLRENALAAQGRSSMFEAEAYIPRTSHDSAKSQEDPRVAQARLSDITDKANSEQEYHASRRRGIREDDSPYEALRKFSEPKSEPLPRKSSLSVSHLSKPPAIRKISEPKPDTISTSLSQSPTLKKVFEPKSDTSSISSYLSPNVSKLAAPRKTSEPKSDSSPRSSEISASIPEQADTRRDVRKVSGSSNRSATKMKPNPQHRSDSGASESSDASRRALMGSIGSGTSENRRSDDSKTAPKSLRKSDSSNKRKSSETRYKHEVLVDNEPILYEILDTCPKSYDDLPSPETINWADGLLLVYSIIDRRSITFLKKVGSIISDDIPVYIVANKNDMVHLREVSAEEGAILARSFECGFSEVAAAEMVAPVAVVFQELCRGVMASRRKSKHSLLERMLGTRTSNLRLYARGKSDSALPKD